MKKHIILLSFFLLAMLKLGAQTVEIPSTGNASGNALFGTSNYAANECIYAESEIGANSFTYAASAITHISYSVATVGTNTTFNSVSIYMKNIPLTTSAYTASSVYDPLASYTLVYSGSVTLSATGFKEIALTTPFVRTSGNNLQVLVIRNDGVTHAGYVYNCANGIGATTTINSTRRYNSTAIVSGSTVLAPSAFRQAIRLTHKNNNDAKVANIYTMGKLPIPYADSQVIKANITNVGVNPLTNIPVTLTVGGANSYTSTQTIASLASGASVVVSFPYTVFTNIGTNTISVSIPTDDDNTNNELTQNQEVNDNAWSYAVGATPTGGVGFNGASGDFIAKFHTSINTLISQVSVNFTAGGQSFKIGIWDDNGANGTPGTLLWESTNQTSTAGLYILPIAPSVPVSAGDFYVGVRQTGTVNVGFAYQTESPIRPQTFYFTSPSGNTTWTDFAPNNPFRFMIEPKLLNCTTIDTNLFVSSCEKYTLNGMTYFQTGVYTQLYISNSGCDSNVILHLTINPLPTINVGNDVIVCNGEIVILNALSDGTIIWSNGVINNQPFYPSSSSSYVATAVNNFGCSNTASVNVTVNPLPNVSAGTGQTICAGQSVTLSGTGATTYTWNNGVSNGVSFVPTATQTYTVTGTNTMTGCSNTENVTVTVNALPNVSGGSNQTICAGQSVTLSGTGATTYTWNNGVSNGVSFVPTATQTYTVTGTNTTTGCSNTANVTVTVNALPNVSGGSSQTICAGQSVTLSGTGATTYTWNNGVSNGVSFVPTATQTYTVTGTNTMTGCSDTANLTITVTVNALPNVSGGSNQTICAGQSVTLSGTGATTYTWNNGVTNGVSFIPTATQTYTVTGTNTSTGCSDTANVVIYVNLSPVVNGGIDKTICFGSSTILNASGASNYSWSGGITNNQSFIPTSTNNYIVTGTDTNGCSNTDTVLITVNSLPTATLTTSNTTICPNGSTTLTASGGVTYLWSNGDTSSTTTVNQAGSYYVIATNAFGCSDTSNMVSITQKAMPTTVKIKYNGASTVCEPATVNYQLDMPLGSTSGFAYQWYNSGAPITGATDSAYSANISGNYSVAISGGNTCVKISSGKVATVNTKPIATCIANGPTTLCSGGAVTISAPVIQGYSYTWLKDGVSAGSGTTKVFKLAGNYTVVAKLNGCMDTASPVINVIVNPLPIASISAQSNLTFCVGDSCTLLATPLNMNSYRWYSGNNLLATTSVPTQKIGVSGTIKVMVVDNNNCTSKLSATNVKTKITPIPIATITVSGSSLLSTTGFVKLKASPTTADAYQWYKDGQLLQGATNSIYITSVGGTFTAQVTKAGCTGVSNAITIAATTPKEAIATYSTEQFEIIAYPNPVEGILTIAIQGVEQVAATIQVMDFSGRLVTMKEMTTISTTVDMTGYASGVYLIRYKDAEGRTGTIKITKE